MALVQSNAFFLLSFPHFRHILGHLIERHAFHRRTLNLRALMLGYNSFLYWIAVTGKNKRLLTDKALKGPLISKEITMFDIGGKILHRSSNINYHRESFFNIWMNRCGLAVWTKPSLGEGIRKAQTYLWMTTSLGFILARTFHHWKENQKSHLFSDTLPL